MKKFAALSFEKSVIPALREGIQSDRRLTRYSHASWIPVLAVLPCLTGCGPSYSREELAVRTSPPFERKWDIEAKDNLLAVDFDAVWGSPYRLFLAFEPKSGKWTDEEKGKFEDFIGKGTSLSRAGTIIPVHWKIEKINGKHEVIATVQEYSIDTAGRDSGAELGTGALDLPPGHYRLSINTTRPIELPPNTEAFIQIVRRRLK